MQRLGRLSFLPWFLLGAVALSLGCGGAGGGGAAAPEDPGGGGGPPPPPPPITGPQLALGLGGSLSMPEASAAHKVKIVGLTYEEPDGTFSRPIVIVYGEGIGSPVWDFQGDLHPARDVFARRSLDEGATWSAPINLSGHALLSSLSVDDDGDELTPPAPYAGDAEKPNVFANGKNVVVTWISRYCPGGRQRSVVYAESGLLEVPYACVWACRSLDGGATWMPPEQLTDGFRDALQDSVRGTGAGFTITWQEDPQGLQPGKGDGPGDGGSGAKVSHGTDVWYAAISTKDLEAGKPFKAPARLTNNFTQIDKDGFESGQVGACRPNQQLVGSTLLLAYEETKGLDGLDVGKYVRYHVLTKFQDPATDPTAGVGWILSTPEANARRARFFAQSEPGPRSGVRIVFLWREGADDNCGPADILMRIGYVDPDDAASTGFRPLDLRPPVADGCEDPALAALNTPPLNVSSSLGMQAGTEDDPLEDSRAHRGLLRDDFIALAWVWTPDQALARWTNLVNYNLYVRRSLDGGRTWVGRRNISNVEDPSISVREPRIMGAPNTPDPSEVRDTDSFFLAWGTEVNQFEAQCEDTQSLDLFITWSADRGVTYAPTQVLAGGPAAQSEAQIRTTADGRTLFAVWMEEDETGASTIHYCSGKAEAP